MIDVVVFCVRIVLACVFLTSGFAKLYDRDATRVAALDLGVPDSVARIAGNVLPFVEIAIGLALPPPPFARFAAIAGCALLAVFTVLVVRASTRSDDVECNCFGGSVAPVTQRTVARNAVLLAAAVFLTLTPASSDPWGPLGSGIEPFAVVVPAALLSLLLSYLLRRRYLRRHRAGVLDQPVEVLDGTTVTVGSVLRAGRPAALLFLEPGCRQCVALLPEIVEWGAARKRLSIAILTPTGGASAEAKFGPLGVPVLVDPTLEVSLSLGVRKRPMGVLVWPNGSVTPPVHGAAAIRKLVAPFLPSDAVRAPPS